MPNNNHKQFKRNTESMKSLKSDLNDLRRLQTALNAQIADTANTATGNELNGRLRSVCREIHEIQKAIKAYKASNRQRVADRRSRKPAYGSSRYRDQAAAKVSHRRSQQRQTERDNANTASQKQAELAILNHLQQGLSVKGTESKFTMAQIVTHYTDMINPNAARRIATAAALQLNAFKKSGHYNARQFSLVKNAVVDLLKQKYVHQTDEGTALICLQANLVSAATSRASQAIPMTKQIRPPIAQCSRMIGSRLTPGDEFKQSNMFSGSIRRCIGRSANNRSSHLTFFDNMRKAMLEKFPNQVGTRQMIARSNDLIGVMQEKFPSGLSADERKGYPALSALLGTMKIKTVDSQNGRPVRPRANLHM